MRYLLIILLLTFLSAELIKPENLDTLSTIHVLFEWAQEPYALDYNIQISKTNIFDDIIIDTNSYNLIYIDQENLDWDSEYYWRVRPIFEDNILGNWIDVNEFYISNSISNSNQNFITNIYDENSIQDGITLFSTWYDERSIAFDKYGKEIWNTNSLNNFIVHVGDYSKLYGFKYPSYNNDDGFYYNAVPMKTNFNNDILISYENLRFNRHDLRQLPNGNFLMLKTNSILGPIPIGSWTSLFQSLGYLADGETNEFVWKYQDIVEIDYDGNEVWNWNFYDYFDFNEYDRYGGTWQYAYMVDYYDWTHSNSIYYDENESAIYLSVRHLSKIIKIDYPSKDIIWNIGLSEQFGTGDDNICTDLNFSWQHDVKKLENGNLLFFDNGVLSDIINDTEDKVSRILEIEVSNNNECSIINEYELPSNYYANSMGSVQLLDNDNYLINTRGNDNNNYIFEINQNKDIIWDTFVGDVTQNNYRAFRIPSIYPEAFSVVFNSLENINFSEASYPGIILSEENTLTIEIFNESGYTQDYQYIFNDNISCFDSANEIITIEANESITLSFQGENIDTNDLTEIDFTVIPINHQYAEKQFHFYVSKSNNISFDFKILKIYPNPFNASSEIIFDVSYQSEVQVGIYNIKGQLLDILLNESKNEGRYIVEWNAQNYSSGVYFVTMTSENFIETQKVTLIK